ncbi:MAG TPA: ribokinase [Chloroflexi bacterium]|nr:ribokinase [Chloroflexota bacterium]
MTLRAIVVGSLVMDLSFLVPKRPEPGEVVVATGFDTFRGGKGYNQAVALARLGANVTLIGAVGDDAYGRQFTVALESEGVDTTRMVTIPDVSTSIAIPMVTPDGDVAFIHAPAANACLSEDAVDDLPDCSLLLIQGEVPVGTSIAAAREARRSGALVMLNPAPARGVTPELIDVCGIITPNEIEARSLIGNRIDSPVAAAQLLARGRRGAVITLGAQGAAWAIDGQAGHELPPAIEAVDATGASDSFCAALAIALVEGQAPDEAVRFACAAGAAAVMVRGAEPGLPNRGAIERLLNR